MSSGPPPPKKPRTTLQQVGRVVKGAFHKPSSQSLPPDPADPSSQPTQNQPSGSTTQPAQIQGATGPARSSTTPLRGVKRAARAAWSMLGNALRTLEQSSDMFPPVKPAINGLLAGIDFLEASPKLPYTCTSANEAGQGMEEYDELASDLAIVLTDLAKHLQESRSIQMSNCVSNIISGIEEQIEAIKLKTDRRGLDRFLNTREDLDDLIECYRRIETLFRQLQSNAVLSIWSITNEQLANSRLESMQPAKNAHYDSAIPAVVRRRQCTPNTRQAVLQDLRTWKNDPNGAKIYWMNGMAGTGKTTIASTLCSELEASRQLGASFFCSRELPDCRDPSRIIPTISYRLARFSLPFQSALCETLRNDPDASARSLEVQFKKLIREPLLRVKKAIPEGVVVVLDALDECADSVSTQLLLDALYKCATDLPLRFFVTCRPDQSLSERLLSWNRASRTLFHLHDIEQSVVRGDIEIYLSAELGELPVDHIRQLSERSGKLFIFAATVVRYVKPNNTSGIWHDRLETMLSAKWSPGSKAYNSIDILYSTILSAALSRDELEPADVETMKQVLYTVICAKEPMTIKTLAGVLGVSVGRLDRVVDSLRSVLHVSEGNQLVSTLHASFPDYMLNQDRSKGLFCNTSAHHHFLALRCFDVMKKSLRFNICNLESSHVLDADVPGLVARVDNAVSSHLFYACSHWADHLCEPEAEERLMALLDEFFSNSMLFWLEVLSLKTCIGVGATMLAKLQKWSQGHNAPSAVYRIAQDAIKFATLAGTCQSTPHIYMSVLALWNREDPMWKSYGTRIQGLVQLGGVLHLKEASGLLATWNTGDKVSSIAASLDGSRIVSNYGKQFIVWDAYTGNKILSPTTGHTMSVYCVAISPNGRSIASGSIDGTIYIWDAETADIIAGPLDGHTSSVLSVAFSPDSARIASASFDYTICIWDAQTGRMLIGRLEGHTDSVESVAFSPDGSRVASGSDDETIRIWNAQTGHMFMRPLEGHTDGVASVAFSPDGARIASGSRDHTIRIWDAQNGDMLAGPFREQSLVNSVAFSLDGSRIVSGSSGSAITVRCTHSGGVLASFDTGADMIWSVVFSPDGNRLIAGSADCTISIWDVNAASLCVNQPDSQSSPVRSQVFSPDSSCIALGFYSGTVRIWDMHTGSLLGGLSVPDAGIFPIALSPNGAHLALGLNGNIDIWDVKNTNKLLSPLKGHTSQVCSLAFSPDGKRLTSGSDDGTILLWDIQTGSVLSSPLKGHACSIRSVAFSPDGARIASGSEDRTVRIWDGQNGDMILGPLRGHSKSVDSARFSPDGRHVVSGSRDSIRVWDAQTGSMLADHFATGNLESFSPDLGRIVTGSWSGAIWIRDAQTEQTLAGPFKAHTGDVDFVAFSPDGSRVVSSSRDGQIFIWELRESDHDVRNVAGTWGIRDDGWIVGRNSARLLWLPVALRTLPRGTPIAAHNRGPFGVDTDWAR